MCPNIPPGGIAVKRARGRGDRGNPRSRRPLPRRDMPTDAIVLLKNDHKEILKTFKEFEKAGENATKKKGQLVDRMIELLNVHTYIENEVMYPRVRELLPELE